MYDPVAYGINFFGVMNHPYNFIRQQCRYFMKPGFMVSKVYFFHSHLFLPIHKNFVCNYCILQADAFY